MNTLRIYRPKTLLLALSLGIYAMVCVPFVVLSLLEVPLAKPLNTAMFANPMFFVLAVLVILVGILLQAGANAYNDYEDYLRGVDTSKRLGEARMSQEKGAIWSLNMALGALVGALVLWCVVVLLLVFDGISWQALNIIFGAFVLLMLSAFAYSGGPLPISHTPFGEAMVFVYFGPLVCVASFVMVFSYLPSMEGRPDFASLGFSGLLGLIPGSLAMNVLLVNNIRDHEGDQKAGRLTFPIFIHKTFGNIRLSASLYFLPLACFVWVLLRLPLTLHALPLLAFILLLSAMVVRLGCAVFMQAIGKNFNALLNQSAKLAAFGTLGMGIFMMVSVL